MLTGEELFHSYMKRICQTFKKWLTTSCIRYSLAYPDFVEAVRFHQAFEEARVMSLQPIEQRVVLDAWAQRRNERTGESRRRATT
ncbi:hypothetical protein OJAV_G00143590 [Oryzias javanicus]|uniref:Uncharacterized protein n=1 Tax=Oryzias javanicus TaxID=123683 RepID=A0A3S2LYS5_ORYJA|nr:hypothetical protein OJAV_G00143590 [Oryzias javanicus]